MDPVRQSMNDYSSPYAYELRASQLVREKQIALETMHIIREQLADCVRTANVNQHKDCKELRDKYAALTLDVRKGMLAPPGIDYPPLMHGNIVKAKKTEN
jgi:hypothetical protein